MKHYKFKSGPNKLLEVSTWKLDPEGVVGFVALQSDHGGMTFAINRAFAEEIRDQMQEFLDGKAPVLPTS